MPKSNSTAVLKLRREQAEKRQSLYASLTTEQKLERIESRPGSSKRERARLKASK